VAAGGIKASDVLNELESHLRDDVDQQVRSGMSFSVRANWAAFSTAPKSCARAQFPTHPFGPTKYCPVSLFRKCTLGFMPLPSSRSR
jgi:hypothetical protein